MNTIQIQSEFMIEAKLCTPSTKTSKLFIIISGSGNGDMDGNLKRIKPNMYQLLSDELIKSGFATLRYNKRGIGASEGNFHETGLQDFLVDLDACVTYARNTLQYKEIYLLGHSEGCMIATLYSKDHDIEGMILLSGAGIALKSAILEQTQSIIEEISVLKGFKGKLLRLLVKEKSLVKKQTKLFKKFTDSDKDMVRVQFFKMPAKWFREHFAYNDEDFLTILRDTKIPVLAITGSKDVQANPIDLDNLETLQNSFIETNKAIEMDHLLRTFTGTKTILNLKKQYKKDVKKPLSEELLGAIAMWTNKHIK